LPAISCDVIPPFPSFCHGAAVTRLHALGSNVTRLSCLPASNTGFPNGDYPPSRAIDVALASRRSLRHLGREAVPLQAWFVIGDRFPLFGLGKYATLPRCPRMSCHRPSISITFPFRTSQALQPGLHSSRWGLHHPSRDLVQRATASQERFALPWPHGWTAVMFSSSRASGCFLKM
jgi:hypothetical protein